MINVGLKRFFLPPDFIETDKVRFPGDIARQMQRVLRLRKGDQVIALDGRGGEYTVRIDYLSPEKAGGEITAKQQAVGEAVCMVALYVSLSQCVMTEESKPPEYARITERPVFSEKHIQFTFQFIYL